MNFIGNSIKKIRRNLHDFGIAEAFRKGVQYLFKRVYIGRKYRLYRRDLTAERFPEHVVEGIKIRLIGHEDRQAIRQIEDMEEWLHGKLPALLSQGFCVTAFNGDQVVGFNLVALREVLVSLINMRKTLRPHQAWSEQITVAKPYRKKGLATALRYSVFAELQKRGIRTFYGGTLISNIASLRSAEKAGFRFIADVHYRKVLSRERRIWRKIGPVGA